MIQKIVSIFILIGLGWFSVQSLSQKHWASAYKKVCSQIETEYFSNSPQLAQWADSCRREADTAVSGCRQHPQIRTCLAQSLNGHLEKLGVSHLFISTPIETDDLLFHTSFDTGIRVRLIEELFVVTEIKPRSAAALAGLRVGDVLASRNGIDLRYTSDARQSGLFKVNREGQILEVQIQGRYFQEDARPFLTQYAHSFAVLKIPSFEGDYRGVPLFEEEEWRKIVEEFLPVQHLVIDLRENLGGNFVSMLRAASPFFCEPTSLGKIVQNRRPSGAVFEFPNRLEADFQIALLNEYQQIDLKTYGGYPCFKGRVTVLVDHNTASVAEIFAQGIKKRAHSYVMGHPTSGSVLVAKRSEISEFGYGYTLSIPVAEYVSDRGELKESFGIQPDEFLFYEKEDALDGIDSWIETVRSKSR